LAFYLGSQRGKPAAPHSRAARRAATSSQPARARAAIGARRASARRRAPCSGGSASSTLKRRPLRCSAAALRRPHRHRRSTRGALQQRRVVFRARSRARAFIVDRAAACASSPVAARAEPACGFASKSARNREKFGLLFRAAYFINFSFPSVS